MENSPPHSVHGFESPSPKDQDLYRAKPLPTPPVSFKGLSPRSRASYRRQSSDTMVLRPPPRATPTSQSRTEPASHICRNSSLYRRNSQKVHQLTGHTPSLLDDPEAFERDVTPPMYSNRSSASSNYSNTMARMTTASESIPEVSEFSENNPLPPLEVDCDTRSSKTNSWTPDTPRQALHSEFQIGCEEGTYAPSTESPHFRSNVFSYFSDNETADRYHKIAADLAICSSRESTIQGPPPSSLASPASPASPLPRRPSNRLSFSSRLFTSRRRAQTQPTPTAATATATATATVPRSSSMAATCPPRTLHHPHVASISSNLGASSTPRSFFESDDDEEENEEERDIREAFKDFFRPRSSVYDQPPVGTTPLPRSQLRNSISSSNYNNNNKSNSSSSSSSNGSNRPDTPNLFTRTGGQVKDLLHSAKDGARMMHIGSSQRRRNRLKGMIRVIPEATVETEKNVI